jgi:predicted DNA-binding transcriptional regulator AlpA
MQRDESALPRRYLNTIEAAAYTGFSKQQFEAWRLNDQGPPYLKFPRLVKYHLPDLDAWMLSHRKREAA